MLLLTILCILLTWWIGHCLQLISIHSFARHFVGLVAKHRARKSAHTYLNRPISILAIISQNFESEASTDDRQLPPPVSKFPLSLSLFLVSSFFLSIHQFRKSFVAASSISKQRSSVELSRSQAVALRFEKCRGLCRCEDRERKKSNSERIASLTRFRIHMFSFPFERDFDQWIFSRHQPRCLVTHARKLSPISGKLIIK